MSVSNLIYAGFVDKPFNRTPHDALYFLVNDCFIYNEEIYSISCYVSGEALIPMDVGIVDNYRVKKQLLHSWYVII